MKKTAPFGLALAALVLIPFQLWLRPGLALSESRAALAAQPVTSIVGKIYLPLAMSLSNSADTHPFGITMYDGIDTGSGTNQMRAAGATRVLTDLKWSVIEPTQGGGYHWSTYDTRLKNAVAAGMSIHVVFSENPAWASSHPNGPVTPTFSLNLQNVISATAQRYNGANGLPRIDSWTLYGEPDNLASWGNSGAAYADMLATMAPIIHKANPMARVMLGGLAYDCFVDDPQEQCATKHWKRSFLPDTLNQLNTHPGGAAAYVDAVAFNFYPISLWRWPMITDKAQAIRGVMNTYGVGQLPLVVPEMSMWSMWPNNVETQSQQAAWLVQFYTRGLSVGIQQMYWFEVFDTQPVGPGSALGLFRGSSLADPKQSYTAYQVLTHQLAGRSFSRSLSVSNAEGYVFGAGALQKTVVWGMQPSFATPVAFALSCARRVDMLGATTQILDGGLGDTDGAFNGAVRLNVEVEKPIYVGPC